MGGMLSRQNAGVEEVDIGANHAYHYPPKQGNYFSSHFIMGGDRFDTAQPEMYLFGENMDLNFLGSRPAPFPYPAPTPSEPSKTLKALINIRKESLRLVKVPEETQSLKGSEPVQSHSDPLQQSQSLDEPHEPPPAQGFNIEFTFDCDVRCAITVMYFCTEETTSQGLVYVPKDPSMNSETYQYKRGANQQFAQASHILYPANYSETDMTFNYEREMFPVVVHCVAQEGEEPRQSQATIGIIEKQSEGYVLKSLKQKLFVHGLCYLLQEIYGIENKNCDNPKGGDEDGEDNGAECVICMCDLRDTLILPCRHLCLCNSCADSLRYQANNCPICRAPFRALLQIKALQKSSINNQPALPAADNVDVPAGYEAVSLIEALNGPAAAPPVQPNAPPYKEMYIRLPQNPGRGESPGTVEDSTTQTDTVEGRDQTLDINTPMRMSALLASQEEGEGGDGRNKKKSNRDSLKIINEASSEGSSSPSLKAESSSEVVEIDHPLSEAMQETVPSEAQEKSATGVTDDKSKEGSEKYLTPPRTETEANPPHLAISMPGTPLSNASDVSHNSVHSNQALLSTESNDLSTKIV